MKKTALYKEIDGHKVVMGFSDATIDPVETAKAVNAVIEDTPEWQAAEAKKAEFGEAAKSMTAAKRSIVKRINEQLKANENLTRDNVLETMDITTENHDYAVAIQKMKETQRDMPSIADALDAKIIALRHDNAVYFEPRAGEVILDASQIEALTGAFKARKQGTVITLEGNVIEDNRGVSFYRKPKGGKWGKTRIVKIGDKVPGDAKFDSDITEGIWDEIEADRVSGLTAAQRDLEKSKAMNDAINTAADMRSRLEIQGDTDALAKSKESYDIEVARVVKLYG